MFRTNLKCRSAGKFGCNMVVSMRPFKGADVGKVVEICSRYDDAHGAPVHVGAGEAIGVGDITRPDWGDPVVVLDDEVCVWWACGVTAQESIENSGVDFAICHAPGMMFVADVRR